MRMLILAGGLGTRLKEAVSHVPKPMAPVGDTPFLYYQLEHWIAHGVKSFVFLLHYQADIIESFLEQNRNGLLAGCEVLSVVEPDRLDTGGAVAYAVHTLGINGDFIVTNADTWLGSGINELSKTDANSMIIIKQPDVSRFGQVEVDNKHFITAFREKGQLSGEGWINAGMCRLNSLLFKDWNGQRMSLEKDIFPPLLEMKQLKAVKVECDFIDIGIPEEYRRFCAWQMNNRKDRLCS